MLKKDKVRITLIAGVIAVALLVLFFPTDGTVGIGKKIRLGLDLKGGVHIVLKATATKETPLTNDSIDKLVTVIRNRIDQYGVTEPVIQREGGDRVVVDLPGLADLDAARALIGRTAVLEFRQVVSQTPELPPQPERKNYDNDEQFAKAQTNWNEMKKNADNYATELAKGTAAKEGLIVARDEGGKKTYTLGTVYVTGKDLQDARVTYDEFGKPAVSLKFNKEGSVAFENATGANIGQQIAIVLDGTVASAPVVRGKIAGGQAQITGNFSAEEANQLAIVLRAGALPVGVEILETRSVGPTLGTDSIHDGIRSGFIGAALVALFMLVYYGMLGIAADIAMCVAMLLLMTCMVALRTTLTLPGIGGIILTIGMAVDGNILIYERMKEEYRSGKTLLAALDAGFRKALVVILDSNITTLIAAGVLFYFGAGPVRGFAVTLSFGVVTAMFGNLVVTKAILQIMLGRRKTLTF